jgi:ribonuclease HII
LAHAAGGEAAFAAVAAATGMIKAKKTRDKVMERSTQNIIYENNIASAQ